MLPWLQLTRDHMLPRLQLTRGYIVTMVTVNTLPWLQLTRGNIVIGRQNGRTMTSYYYMLLFILKYVIIIYQYGD